MEYHPEAGYCYRSDHFNFAKQGVPALYAKGGSKPLNEQTAI
jgi:Zn-dependent M28 family amino/carboxypeptidase